MRPSAPGRESTRLDDLYRLAMPKLFTLAEREGIVETKRGVGTFISGQRPPAMHDAHRERRLKEIVDRLLTDAASIGFTPREISKYLARRVKEGE